MVILDALERYFAGFIVLLPFSNRCLSSSDKTHSTTWLHPRTGEPVNSGHMIRSGTPQTYVICRISEDIFAAVFTVAGRSACFLFFCFCWRYRSTTRMGRGLHGRRSQLLHQVSGICIVALFDRVKCNPAIR